IWGSPDNGQGHIGVKIRTKRIGGRKTYIRWGIQGVNGNGIDGQNTAIGIPDGDGIGALGKVGKKLLSQSRTVRDKSYPIDTVFIGSGAPTYVLYPDDGFLQTGIFLNQNRVHIRNELIGSPDGKGFHKITGIHPIVLGNGQGIIPPSQTSKTARSVQANSGIRMGQGIRKVITIGLGNDYRKTTVLGPKTAFIAKC